LLPGLSTLSQMGKLFDHNSKYTGFILICQSEESDMAHILVVDNDKAIRNIIADALEQTGHKTVKAISNDHAMKLVKNDTYDIVVTNLNAGISILRAAKDELPDAEVIMTADCNAKKIALKAMRSGAWDYVVKPISLQQLSLAINRALEKKQLTTSLRDLHEQSIEKYSFRNMVASDKKMQYAVELAKQALTVDVPVLIIGESGTGKHMLANIIHAASSRVREPFISTDLSCIDEKIMESVIFGSVNGAIDGYGKQRKPRLSRSVRGIIERADRGTVFLNEITAAPASVKEKFSEFMEYGMLSRAGSDEMIHANTRLIAGSSADAVESVERGGFREDLFRQFSQISIHLPPLKERKDDIPLLADHFVSIYSKQSGKRICEMSPESLSFLMSYNWPGNVRELSNVIEYAIAFTNEEIIPPSSLPVSVRIT